ncbi:hypothetical protein QBZ16_003910 [Prototheca wickerhamii]|uniref:Protein BTN n=1 Tax=Prototheca wickerhamii TaxID=3111 RepID=A0AAD9IL90_PROWI|nr:hypothetical protein QBZ16_003910 [Prototheca wickerhamii]
MLAGANSISAAAVGLVYLAAVGPAILVKASGPYWFHMVGYPIRIGAAAALMTGSFCIVALSSSRPLQLLGGGLGEASCLALTTRYGPRRGPLTLWSSGTGFAGIAGYAWVAALHMWAGLSFRATLLLANSLAIGWLATYFLLLPRPTRLAKLSVAPEMLDDDEEGSSDAERVALTRPSGRASDLPRSESGRRAALAQAPSADQALRIQEQPGPSASLTARERLRLSLSLWPFTVPLFVVYFAEYSMQAGAWTAIGFPVTDPEARHRFYIYANWCYQAGVFVSRSSGMVWRPGMRTLWAMPGLQALLLAFFVQDAVAHCPGHREFSMAAASLADSTGIALADAVGVLLQGCLFRANGLPGADFACA